MGRDELDGALKKIERLRTFYEHAQTLEYVISRTKRYLYTDKSVSLILLYIEKKTLIAEGICNWMFYIYIAPSLSSSLA